MKNNDSQKREPLEDEDLNVSERIGTSYIHFLQIFPRNYTSFRILYETLGPPILYSHENVSHTYLVLGLNLKNISNINIGKFNLNASDDHDVILQIAIVCLRFNGI